MSYRGKSKGSGYGKQNRKGSQFFHSDKKQKFADQIAQEKQKLENEVASGETSDAPFHRGYVVGRIDALTWVEGKLPLDSVPKSEHSTKDPVKVQCPRDNTIFEPVIGESYDGTGKGIWCPKCGATFNFEPETNKWSTSDGSLKIID